MKIAIGFATKNTQKSIHFLRHIYQGITKILKTFKMTDLHKKRNFLKISKSRKSAIQNMEILKGSGFSISYMQQPINQKTQLLITN